MSKLRSTCWFCTAPLLLLCVLWALPNAHAQVASSITGSVTDPTGAVIPGATVTATNEGTNVPVSRQTNSDGLYLIPELLPGFYTVTAEAKGFTKLVNQRVELTVGYSQPSVDTVQEFRVDTEALSAEYGSTVGAVTQIVLKSGSNSPHGTAYEYVRNEKFDAREFFEGPTRNPFKMNQFGATLGGPIKKNKLFFFGSYEGERTRVSTPESLSIETPQFGNFITTNLPNSVAALLYKNFPGPAPTSGIDNLATYVTADSVGAGYAATSCDPSAGGGFTAACLNDTYGLAPGSALAT